MVVMEGGWWGWKDVGGDGKKLMVMEVGGDGRKLVVMEGSQW